MSDLFHFSTQLKPKLMAAITEFLVKSHQFEFDHHLLDPVKEFVTLGKLFRAEVCLQTTQHLLNSSQPPASAWSAAVALELAGSALLIQDDITDEAILRRTKPALYRTYTQLWPGSKVSSLPANHFGESAAMYVSDTLFFMATRILTQADCSAEIKVALLDSFSHQIATLALCQSEEMRVAALPLTDENLTESKIIQILIGKSARYTAMWPLEFASILAQASPEVTERLQRFGQALGLVFQLSDDRLGLFGDSDKTGKDLQSDAETGKKTLYALYARDRLGGSAKTRFLELYGSGKLSSIEFIELQTLLKQAGIDKAVAQVTADYAAAASHELAGLETQYPQLTHWLSQMVEFLVNRDH